MNDQSASRARRPVPKALIAAVLISLPFWIGAAVLAWDAANLPEKAGNLARARCWQSPVFALGLACGITGSAVALCLRSARARALGIAGTLLGFAGVLLSLIMGWYIDRAGAARSVSLLPFAVPSALVFAALMVLLNTVKFTDDSSVNETQDANPQ